LHPFFVKLDLESEQASPQDEVKVKHRSDAYSMLDLSILIDTEISLNIFFCVVPPIGCGTMCRQSAIII